MNNMQSVHVIYPFASISTTTISRRAFIWFELHIHLIQHVKSSSGSSPFNSINVPYPLHIPLRMNVRVQLGYIRLMLTFRLNFFLYTDCSIRIYFSDGEGTISHVLILRIIVNFEGVLDAFTIFLFIVDLPLSLFML